MIARARSWNWAKGGGGPASPFFWCINTDQWDHEIRLQYRNANAMTALISIKFQILQPKNWQMK